MDPSIVDRMLEAAPHRGDICRVESAGSVAIGVSHPHEWPTAWIAREIDDIAAFSGTLDNADDLRDALAESGVPRRLLGTPAEILLHSHRQWGSAGVGRLRGKFAGALTEGGALHLFRDHFGRCPLFLHDNADGFFAATEVKQILAGAPISREPDLDHLHGVLFGGIGTSTAYRGVERVPQQHVATVQAEGDVRLERYWDPSEHVESLDIGPEEAVRGTVRLLEQAVRRVLTGDDVILLSGGLDSPALAAFTGKGAEVPAPVRALTAIYPEYPSADEREWTTRAADYAGIPLDTFVPSAGSMDDIDYWVDLLDGPVAVVSMPETAEAYREARKLGARTVINGEIAEMLFENRFYLLGHLLSHGRFRHGGRLIEEMRERDKSWIYILRTVLRAVAPGWLLATYRTFRPAEVAGLPPWVDAAEFTRSAWAGSLWRTGPRRRWMQMQAMPFSGPGAGFEADDICAAVCGVNSRRPFSDVDLWEFVLGLPAEVKFPGPRSKPLLREAMRGLLPDTIIDRKDKTLFDEYHLAKADYPTLRRLLLNPDHHLRGIDYEVLADRLEQADLRIYELQWARNVARVHAFLNRW